MQSPATGNGHGPADPLVNDAENSSSSNHRTSSQSQPIGSRVTSKKQRGEPLPLEPLTSPDRTMGINSVPYPQRLEPVKIPLKPDNIIVFTVKSLSITEVISVLNRARIEDTGASQCFSGFLLAVLPVYIIIQIALWSILVWLYSSLYREPCRHDLALWALVEGLNGFVSLVLNATTTILFTLFVDPINPTRTAVIINWFKLLVGVFSFAWTMAGTVWTFSLARAAPDLATADCSQTLFLWSFAYCIFFWCVVAPLFCFMFFAIFVRGRRIAARNRAQPQHLPPPSRRLSSESYSARSPAAHNNSTTASRSLRQVQDLRRDSVTASASVVRDKDCDSHDNAAGRTSPDDIEEQKEVDHRTLDLHEEKVVLTEDQRREDSGDSV